MEFKKHKRFLRHVLSIPFIWLMLIPLIILDLFMFLYHSVCFRLYGIPLVKRKEYLKIDRHKLKYLKLWDKVNCAYCGYANGLMHYASRIAGDTEKYWCSIKHKKTHGFKEPKHHEDFLEYGDEASFKEKYG